MLKLSDIREKEIININNGEKMGYVYDFELDLDKGKVVALIMSGPSKVLGLFGGNGDIIIGWEDIVKIGTDAILVDFNGESLS